MILSKIDPDFLGHDLDGEPPRPAKARRSAGCLAMPRIAHEDCEETVKIGFVLRANFGGFLE